MSTVHDPLYRRDRFPPEVTSYAVWLYFRFPLSLRMVEEMLAARGICVTYETVRQWGRKFGKTYSATVAALSEQRPVVCVWRSTRRPKRQLAQQLDLRPVSAFLIEPAELGMPRGRQPFGCGLHELLIGHAGVGGEGEFE